MDPKGPEATGSVGTVTPHDFEEHFFVGGPATRELERIITEIAPTEIPVLLVGESGSGKEVAALRIHQLSRRSHEQFLKLSCATLAAEALEQPLRVSEKGNGIQVLARAGTIFLDEICDLDPAIQPKVLHVLPDGDAVPDGHCLRARLISASGRNLEEEIRAGRFREELYYRLNGVCLRLPPLRQRKEDIPALVDFFLAKYSTLFGRSKPTFSSETLDRLIGYSWPGNIRQLENAVKKVVAVGDERLALGDLETFGSSAKPPNDVVANFSLKQAARAASRQAERELILKTLERTRWNRKRAAKELQISYKALLYKLKQIGLEDSAESLSPREEHA